MCVPNLILIHPVFIEIFQSEPTDRHCHPLSHATTMADNLEMNGRQDWARRAVSQMYVYTRRHKLYLTNCNQRAKNKSFWNCISYIHTPTNARAQHGGWLENDLDTYYVLTSFCPADVPLSKSPPGSDMLLCRWTWPTLRMKAKKGTFLMNNNI